MRRDFNHPNEPFFSICLSTYNRFEYLKYTIDNILNQIQTEEPNFEIIVCDSGSTDGTLEYLNYLDIVKV